MSSTPGPLEARCDHCKQTRPLFLYRPEHDFHLVPRPCRWCDRDAQPLLCARCWETERIREDSDLWPGDKEAAEAFHRQIGNEWRLRRQAETDKATCEGIVAATGQAAS